MEPSYAPQGMLATGSYGLAGTAGWGLARAENESGMPSHGTPELSGPILLHQNRLILLTEADSDLLSALQPSIGAGSSQPGGDGRNPLIS